ncbi:MAG: diacylglycerol kinase family protein [Lachnospiraceae bacterium]|nr:diacylglycerol kinase family protein [Lachnospiraceae bacterium]
MSTYVLYNGLSGNGTGKKKAEDIHGFLSGKDPVFMDITSISDIKSFISGLGKTSELYLCGGDGTLNRFINDTDGMEITQPLYFFPTGSGNDFWNDLGKKPGDAPVQINRYITDLPFVEVNGMKRRFINGIGYGIDGYCCEVGDQMRAAGNEKIDYAGIAIKGLLFHYKPTNAEIDVDGKKYSYKKVWLAPSMNGRYYGGGMIATPGQDRLGKDRLLSLLVFHGSGKIRTLAIFPSIFKGKHVDHKKVVEVRTGHRITVTFDRPVALQIDGETVLNVTTYTAYKD